MKKDNDKPEAGQETVAPANAADKSNGQPMTPEDAANLTLRMKQIENFGFSIQSKQREVQDQESQVASAKAAAKEEQAELTRLMHELEELQTELANLACGKFSGWLFPLGSDAAKRRDEVANAGDRQFAQAVKDGLEHGGPGRDAWKKVPLKEMGVKGKLLENLEAVGIATIGDYAAAAASGKINGINGVAEKSVIKLAELWSEWSMKNTHMMEPAKPTAIEGKADGSKDSKPAADGSMFDFVATFPPLLIGSDVEFKADRGVKDDAALPEAISIYHEMLISDLVERWQKLGRIQAAAATAPKKDRKTHEVQVAALIEKTQEDLAKYTRYFGAPVAAQLKANVRELGERAVLADKAVNAAKVGLETFDFEANMHPSLLAALQAGEVPELRAVAMIGNMAYVCVAAVGDGMYRLKRLYAKAPKELPKFNKSPEAGDDAYVGGQARHDGQDLWLAPQDEDVIVSAPKPAEGEAKAA